MLRIIAIQNTSRPVVQQVQIIKSLKHFTLWNNKEVTKEMQTDLDFGLVSFLFEVLFEVSDKRHKHLLNPGYSWFFSELKKRDERQNTEAWIDINDD